MRTARTSTLTLDRPRRRAARGSRASGIAHFDVYRSTNRGAYKRIKRTTAHDRCASACAPGSRYRFYTVAVDKAGNREAVPAATAATSSTRVG